MQQLADNVENAEHEVYKKKKEISSTAQEKAEAEGDLDQTVADHAEDQKYLEDTIGLCKKKEDDFASRQKLRAEEVSSIKKAIEIISSDSVAGSGEKHLPTFVQLKRRAPPAALAQLRSGEQDSPSQQRASEFLRE